VAVAEWLAITYWRRRNQGVLPLPDEVADAVVAGTSDERFLILPQADVAKHLAFKGAQPERWLEGMGGLLRHARDQARSD